MRYAIASDIHGSALWCRRMLESAAAEGAGGLILLGDLMYHGPRNALPEGYDPAEVASMLNGFGGAVAAVRGNCDAEVDQMLLDFPCMGDYSQLVDESGRTLWLTHGHLWNPDLLPPLAPGSAFLYGHTHVKQLAETPEGITLFNPGSVSIPKDGSHSYGIYEDGQFRFELLEESE